MLIYDFAVEPINSISTRYPKECADPEDMSPLTLQSSGDVLDPPEEPEGFTSLTRANWGHD
jgi:hypothetical protein